MQLCLFNSVRVKPSDSMIITLKDERIRMKRKLNKISQRMKPFCLKSYGSVNKQSLM